MSEVAADTGTAGPAPAVRRSIALATDILQAALLICVVGWVVDIPRRLLGLSFYTEQLLAICLGLSLALAFVAGLACTNHTTAVPVALLLFVGAILKAPELFKRPGLVALMTLFMLSLASIPGTVGFIAKFTIFAAAINADVVWLTILGLLASVVSVYYYLRLPVLMYMREPTDDGAGDRREVSSGEALVLGLCAIAVVYLGLFPNAGSLPIFGDVHVLDWARQSVEKLFSSGLG